MRRLRARYFVAAAAALTVGLCTACGSSDGEKTAEPVTEADMDGRFPIPGWLPSGAVVAGTLVPIDPGAPATVSIAFGQSLDDGFDGAVIATVTEGLNTSLPEGESIAIDGELWIETDDDERSVSLWRMAGAGPMRIRAVTGDRAPARQLASAIVVDTDTALQIGFEYLPAGLEIIGRAASPPRWPVPTLKIESPDGRATITTRPHQTGTIAAEAGEARRQRIRGLDGYAFAATSEHGIVWREPLVGSVTISGDLPTAALLRIAEGLTFGSQREWDDALSP